MNIFTPASHIDARHSTFNEIRGDQYNVVINNDGQLRYPFNILSRSSALGAAYDSFEREPVHRCLPDTYADVQAHILDWVESPGDRRVFWLSGSPGVGKTALAQTIAEHCAKRSRLGASFFCYRGNEERSDGRRMFPTIALQLATSSVPSSYSPISDALAYDLSIFENRRFQDQLQKLIINPLLTLPQPLSAPAVVVIDALDECEDKALMAKIISLFALALADRKVPLQLFVTSRPVPHINEIFQGDLVGSHTRSLSLDKPIVQGNVRCYLQSCLDEIWRRHNHPLSPDDVDALAKLTDGSFIYASTAVRFIGDEDSSLAERLSMVLSVGKGIDCLYQKIWSLCPDQDRMQLLVGTVILLSGHLLLAELANLLNWSSDDLLKSLRGIRALLFIPHGSLQYVRIYHASLREFVTDKRRAAADFINPRLYHAHVARHCLTLMAKNLKRDMAGLEDSDSAETTTLWESRNRRGDIRSEHEGYVGGALRYACCYWASHLAKAQETKELLADLEVFASTNVLYWIEALSLIGKLDTAEQSLQNAIKWLETSVDAPPFLRDLFTQVKVLTSRFLDYISVLPIHVYHNVLTHMPRNTILYQLYESELVRTHKKIVEKLRRVDVAINRGKQSQILNADNQTLYVDIEPQELPRARVTRRDPSSIRRALSALGNMRAKHPSRPPDLPRLGELTSTWVPVQHTIPLSRNRK